jgi:hypothetical protein
VAPSSWAEHRRRAHILTVPNRCSHSIVQAVSSESSHHLYHF